MTLRASKFLWLVAALSLATLLSGCGRTPASAAGPTSSPAPTITAAPTATSRPDTAPYPISGSLSSVEYLATGPFNLQLPGKFSVLGNAVSLITEPDGVHVRVDVVIDGASVTAVDRFVRDALRGALEVDKFPTGHFLAESKDAVKLGDTPVTVTVSGTLELHGKSQPVDMAITLSLKDGKIQGGGQTLVDLLDYGVNVPTAIISSKVTFKAVIQTDAGDPATPSTPAR